MPESASEPITLAGLQPLQKTCLSLCKHKHANLFMGSILCAGGADLALLLTENQVEHDDAAAKCNG